MKVFVEFLWTSQHFFFPDGDGRPSLVELLSM